MNNLNNLNKPIINGFYQNIEEINLELANNLLSKTNDDNHQIILTYNDEETTKLSTNLKLDTNSFLKLIQVVITNNDFELDTKIDLIGPNAQCEIITFYLSSNQLTSKIQINHLCHNTTSSLDTTPIGINQGHIELINNGHIAKGCQKSTLNQKARGLTLSKTSQVIIHPNLFIDESDVIASHSSIIGSLSHDELFYLMSRGLSESDALKLYVIGTIQPIIDFIKNSTIDPKISKITDNQNDTLPIVNKLLEKFQSLIK